MISGHVSDCPVVRFWVSGKLISASFCWSRPRSNLRDEGVICAGVLRVMIAGPGVMKIL